MRTKQQASEIITRIRRESPASDGQVKFIESLFRDHNISMPIPADLSDSQASQLIDKLIDEKPITDGQIHKLRNWGFSQRDMLTTSKEARKI